MLNMVVDGKRIICWCRCFAHRKVASLEMFLSGRDGGDVRGAGNPADCAGDRQLIGAGCRDAVVREARFTRNAAD